MRKGGRGGGGGCEGRGEVGGSSGGVRDEGKGGDMEERRNRRPLTLNLARGRHTLAYRRISIPTNDITRPPTRDRLAQRVEHLRLVAVVLLRVAVWEGWN